jgi:hypothetical protein
MKSILLHSLMMKMELSALIVEVLATSGNAVVLVGGETLTVQINTNFEKNMNGLTPYQDNSIARSCKYLNY